MQYLAILLCVETLYALNLDGKNQPKTKEDSSTWNLLTISILTRGSITLFGRTVSRRIFYFSDPDCPMNRKLEIIVKGRKTKLRARKVYTMKELSFLLKKEFLVMAIIYVPIFFNLINVKMF